MSDDFFARTETLLRASTLPEDERANLRLRILADHFCARTDHASADVARILTALCQVIPRAAASAVAYSARRMAVHPQIDSSLLACLAARGGDAAYVAFRFGRGLDPRLLTRTAERGDALSASAIAGRDDLAPDLATILLRRPEPKVLVSLAANRHFQIDRASATWMVSRARHESELARALLARGPLACDLTPLFMSANTHARAAMIGDARRRDVGLVPEFRVPPPPEQAAEIERSLTHRDRGSLASALAKRVGVSRGDAMRFINDAGGEPSALLFNVGSVSPSVTADLLCWLQERPSHDPAVASLMGLSTNLALQTAKRILSAIVGRALTNHHRTPSPRAAASGRWNSVTPSRSEHETDIGPEIASKK